MKRAVLVGVDSYDALSPLGGCCSDAESLGELLRTNSDGSPNFECAVHKGTDKKRISRSVLSELVNEVLAPGAHIALFYFAGHAGKRAADVVLAGQESTVRGEGLAVSDLLGRARESSVSEIVLILDCCYSGAAGRVPQMGGEAAILGPGISVLCACRPEQEAIEDGESGLFTARLRTALGGAASNVLGIADIAGVYAYLSESFGTFEQRPTLLTNSFRPTKLRRCEPALPLAELRLLTSLFETAEADLQLSPEYEPSLPPKDPVREKAFGILQRYRSARLVVPNGADHMYDAARDGQSCKLTLLGQHYWIMAKAGRI